MSDETRIEEIAEAKTKLNNNPPSVRVAAPEDRLDAVKKLVLQANRDAETRASEREQSIKDTELENERRLAETKAKIAENAARAERLASERAARMENGGEYRQRLMARENKKAVEEKKRRQEAELEAARVREDERSREIEEFIRREKEAATKRATASEGLLFSTPNPAPEAAMAEDAPKPSANEEEKRNAAKTVEQSARIAEKPSSVDNEDGKILLEITPGGVVDRKDDDNENVIRINGVQYNAPAGLCGFSTHTPKKPQNSELDAELVRANERHAALKLAAVAKAAGVYRDEIRLLEEEEMRYNREISEIQAKRFEYAEHREYMSSTSEPFETSDGLIDENTRLFDEFSESLVTSERITVEDELSQYEKYREENLQRRESSQAFIDSKDNGESIEYGYFEPSASTEYVESYAEYPHTESAYEKTEGMLKSYEQQLEAKRLAEESAAAEIPSEEELSYHLNIAGDFDKVALLKKLSDYRRTEAALAKKIKKLSAKQNAVSGEEKTLILVEKIGLRKEITELAVEVLTACVYVNAKFKTITYKRVLISQINAYNAVCDEYEMHTGRPLVHLSADMANEVAAGRICDPIPNVYYYGSEAFGARDNGGISIDEERNSRLALEASLEEAELHRLLIEDYPHELTRTELRERDKRQAEKMSAVKRATERDLLLIGLRQDYRLAKLESEYDMLLHSFSTDKKKKDKRLAALERRIGRTRSELKRAVKLERGDNSRYYLLSAIDPEDEKIKKSANRERLRALKMRLDVLLSERENINERLIALYGGTDKKLTKTKINRKAGGVRKKHAKAAYRKQRSIANRIERIKAPLDMKEKAYALLNKKTACVATIEECYYKLRRLKPEGRAKRELLSNIRQAKASMRTVDADVKFLIKKMKRHERRREDERSWAKFLVFLFLLIVLGTVLWYFYADDVLAYFTDLFGKLGIK